ncbi:MAG: PstS family phosphate ABC transporter substrate-binding protein [SAR202 cluster bacterium]|nr:PstS family phosphate ABC transporter substrate-binding protein [SAR202 cluster bacterium]
MNRLNRFLRVLGVAALAATALGAVACSSGTDPTPAPSATQPISGTTPRSGAPAAHSLRGTIEIDGSSTVFPITEAVAEEFRREQRNVQVNVGVSGTGGGFKRFAAGETAISDASRPIKQSEADEAKKNGIEFVELEIAIDGLSVIVNPQNDWVDCLTKAELKKIWEPTSTIKNWKEVRAGFPDRPLNLYGPGTDSGTFDYFTEVINGAVQASRADYTASEDDNTLVQGISGDRNALGYFGYAYFEENAGKLKLVSIDSGKGCVTPTTDTIANGTYSPLSRPLYIYVSKAALAKAEVKAFVEFYMRNGADLSSEVGYIPLSDAKYQQGIDAVK